MGLTQQQIEMRKTGISASEIAAVVGLNPWRSPGDVWADKLGMTAQREQSEAMERGNELEEALVRWTGRRLHARVTLNRETYRSEEYPIALATPDGFLLGQDGPGEEHEIATIEVKAPGRRTADHWRDPAEVPDGCPRYYLVQAQWQAGVMGMNECVVSGLVDGRLLTYRMAFSSGLWGALLDRAKTFWSYVQSKEPPPFEVGQSMAWVGEAYKVQRDADIIEAPADKASELVAAAKQYDLARALIKKTQAEQDAAKAFLQAHIRDHQGLSLPGYRATWAQNKPSDVVQWEQVACQLAVELDRAGVKDAALKYAELEAQYTTRKPGARVFRLITAEGA